MALTKKVALSLGGNQGDRKHILNEAVGMLEKRVGKLDAISSYYETEAWGFETESKFINIIALFDTSNSAEDVLEVCMEIEAELGRKRVAGAGYQSRPIDIDLILMEGVVSDTEHLVLPHPRMHLRNFVLLPLAEVAPTWIHPLFHKTVKELLDACEDDGEIAIC